MTGEAAVNPPNGVNGPVEGPPATATFRVPGIVISANDAARIAATAIEYGWYSPIDRVMVPISGEAAWDDSVHAPATLEAVHTWEPLDALLAAHSYDPENPAIEAASAYAHQWLAAGFEPLEPSIGVAGRRALRLAYLAAAAVDDKVGAAAAAHAASLQSAIEANDISLDTTDAITGLLVLNAASTDLAGEPAERLLLTHLKAVFTDDGMHRSQSPGLQREVIERLRMLLEMGVVSPAEVAEARTKAEHALAWFITPDGFSANFGATPLRPISSAYGPSPAGLRYLKDQISDPAMLHAASAGRFGTLPETNRTIMHDSGFFIIKEPWPTRAEDAAPTSHLVLRTGPPRGGSGVDAGLGFTWHDGGRSLIVEPGPVLPISDHPAAAYATHPKAHNRVVVGPVEPENGDDGDVPPPPSRSDTPLAGGLQRWGLMEGHYFCDSYEATEEIRHRRSIMFEPNSWLLIADVVDPVGRRSVGPRFHLGGDLGVVAMGERFTIVEQTEPIAWAVPLAPHIATAPQRGATEPNPHGWWSPDGVRMMPNWVFGWDAVGPSVFVTLLSLGERPEVAEPQGAWFGWQTARYRARVAVTEWGIVDIDMQRTIAQEG